MINKLMATLCYYENQLMTNRLVISFSKSEPYSDVSDFQPLRNLNYFDVCVC